jgi:hypothetical protein
MNTGMRLNVRLNFLIFILIIPIIIYACEDESQKTMREMRELNRKSENAENPFASAKRNLYDTQDYLAAEQEIKSVMENYPQSKEAAEARKLLEELNRRKAEKEKKELEEAKFAYKGIKFGDNAKTVDRIIKWQEKIGNYEYFFRASYVDEDKKKDLYEILFYANGGAYNFDTQVRRYWENLVDILSKRYGKAIINRDYPDLLKLKPEEIYWTHLWNFKSKEIRIGAGENYYKHDMYSCYLEISDTNRKQTVIDKRSEEYNRSVTKDADKF